MGMWLELDLETKDDVIVVSARGSRGERPPARSLQPEQGLDAVQSFASKVGRAARAGKSLEPAVIEAAQALYEAVFSGDLRDVLARMSEAVKEAKEAKEKDGAILLRLFTSDRTLAAAPWEALCKPGTSEGFLGTEARLLVARGVRSSDPWEPREVRGAVGVLAVAPGERGPQILALRDALGPSIEAGEIEWLDPISGPDISARALFDRLRRGKTPHIVHFIGHGGVDISGRPVLRMADDEDGEEAWITAEALARELGASFSDDLRLVVLEACEGAKAGVLGSAAEVLTSAGADAVIAHLWPVKADVARACSTELYRSLTVADRTLGDIGASLAAARRTLLAQSAEAFSPVLYLRGSSSAIFNFQGRRVSKARSGRASSRLAPALAALLQAQREQIQKPFSVVLGDMEEDGAALRQELAQFMAENGDKPSEGMALSAMTQRCLLRFGQEVLHSLFQQVLTASTHTPSPLAVALGRLVPPGVHVTLCFRPDLERAIAEQQPSRTVYAIQPSVASGGKPRVVKRAAGASAWKMELALPKRIDVEREIVVLRISGGYSAEPRPIFSQPMLTEDDHINGVVGLEGRSSPAWLEELLGVARTCPGLFIGLSALDWKHRMLLRWLYDQRPAPRDSIAILPPAADPSEAEIWESGGGLPGNGRVASIFEEYSALAAQLDAIERGEGS